jgi:ATP-dependent helicase HrpB
MNPLPIDAVLPDIRVAFQSHSNVVLSADPGAGKTTRVPLALLNETWLSGMKIVMLEPRRLAAQRAASYMAQLLGERAGETIGYRIRGDSKIGKRTRIEVVTEGILTKIIQTDPALQGIGLLIFDEFHERSIHADLGLALALDAQEHLRPDLRILIMSATLDGLALSALLTGAPLIKSEGRSFPVTTQYLHHPREGPIETAVVSTISRALREQSGDLLVFLPGQSEIRRVESALAKELLPEATDVCLLFGEAPPEKQQHALGPSPAGRRKIILSTSIAETSLTIEGVRTVIDSGLARSARFDPRRGMSGLVTTPVSRSSADQRRGRAGRQQPGACYRLWMESEQNQLPEIAQPEILVADLAPLALELAQWGAPRGEGLQFLDPPPSAHLSQARAFLEKAGALDRDGKLTGHGRAMAQLPVHPRLSHMLVKGKEIGQAAAACDVAALLEERDLLRGEGDIDLHSRWYVLQKGGVRDRFSVDRVRAQASRLRELIGIDARAANDSRLGVLLALAYPERIAKRRDAQGRRYQLSGGVGAILPAGSMLSREQYLAVGDVDGAGTEAKIFLAEPITEDDIREAFADQLVTQDEVRWDARQEAVIARRVTRLGALDLSETPLLESGDAMSQAMTEGLRQMGIDVLPWTDHAISVRLRSEWLRKQGLVANDWPDLSNGRLIDTVETWLVPYLNGISKRTQLARLDTSVIVDAMFDYRQLQELDRLAPTHLTVPTGSRIPLEYSAELQPVLAVRLQEMFGQTETPTVGGGKVKVVLHLLSPARRPIAVTQDLPSFWKNAYPEVRKDMRGRYPKHFWPENPLEAEPTRRTKRR